MGLILKMIGYSIEAFVQVEDRFLSLAAVFVIYINIHFGEEESI